jgi:hypothetical protein
MEIPARWRIMVTKTLTALMALGLVLALVRSTYAGQTLASGSCSIPSSGPTCCTLITLTSGKCFLLTDVTAANSSGNTRVNIDNAASTICPVPTSAAERVVYKLNGEENLTQSFKSPILFSSSAGDVLASSDRNSPSPETITVTVSGILSDCNGNPVSD